MSPRLAPSITRVRSDTARNTAADGDWMARILCGGAVLVALLAGVLIGIGTVVTPALTPIWVVLFGAGTVFGWCSISFLCGAVVAASAP